MYQIPKIRRNFTLTWRLDLTKTSLEQNLRLETLGYLFLFLAYFSSVILMPHGQHSLTHPMLIIAFGLSLLATKVTGKDWVATPIWVPSGLGLQCHNPLSHSPQIEKNTLPKHVPSFFKIWKCPPMPKIVIAWNCGDL